MLKRLLYCFLFITFSQSNITAQADSIPPIDLILEFTLAETLGELENVNKFPSERYLGSAFYFDFWSSIILYYKGRYFKHDQVKLDLIHKTVHFKTSKGVYSIPFSEFEFILYSNPLDNRSELFYSSSVFNFRKDPGDSFLEYININNYELFVHYDMRIKNPSENAIIMGGDDRKSLEKIEKFYFLNSNRLIQIKNKKDVIQNLNRRKKRKIERYIKENKLKFRLKSDFVLLFNFLEPLESDS